MPVHPQAQAVLDQMTAAGVTFSGDPTVEERRAMFAARRVSGPPTTLVHKVEDRKVPGPGGQIPVRIYHPTDAQGLAVLAWYHGGGWVLGDLDGSDATCRDLAQGANCVVVSVDYRLAPEARFPAAVDDCYAATQWIASSAAELGVDGRRIAVGGDSAGANLAAAVALMARDRGGPQLAHQLLVYPVTDYAFDTGSYRDNAEGYMLTAESMKWFWKHYLGPQGDGSHPYASPARAKDLARLPSALVLTAEYDPLRDEGEAYAALLRQAGVPVTCTRYDGMLHGFFGMAAMLDEGKRAQAQAIASLQAAFARQGR